jgi:hypothetical protein
MLHRAAFTDICFSKNKCDLLICFSRNTPVFKVRWRNRQRIMNNKCKGRLLDTVIGMCSLQRRCDSVGRRRVCRGSHADDALARGAATQIIKSRRTPFAENR